MSNVAAARCGWPAGAIVSGRQRWARITYAEAEKITADARADAPAWPAAPAPVWQWYAEENAQDAHDPREGAIEEFRRYGDPACRLRRVRRCGAWDYLEVLGV